MPSHVTCTSSILLNPTFFTTLIEAIGAFWQIKDKTTTEQQSPELKSQLTL